MSLFCSEAEHALMAQTRGTEPFAGVYWALLQRVEKRAASPGLSNSQATTDWWHHAAEYLSDAAIVQAIHYSPTPASKVWLRDAALSVARRPAKDWSGPAFRNQSGEAWLGQLETAHLSWGLAVVLDLASKLFNEEEREEIVEALREKGIAPCRRALEQRKHLNNWNCILNAGVSVAAAVLDDHDSLAFAKAQYQICQQCFQPDGSYPESLQYGNYAALAHILAREALVRHTPEWADELSLEPYVKIPRWQAVSYFHQKAHNGWGSAQLAVSANFNDSAALFRPSADLLLHIATRAKESHPDEAALARWLFDTLYLPCLNKGPKDLATFGFYNDFGFLTPILLGQAAAGRSPRDSGIPECMGFSCGDMFARDQWNGRTTLAVRGGGEAMQAPSHLHGDLNSFILVHNEEMLLIDPGHSCYRNHTRELDIASRSHNTCTFLYEDKLLEQKTHYRRPLNPSTGEIGTPIDRGGKRLLLARSGNITVLGSEAATLYGEPLEEFSRFWILCGSHALFIVDRIKASKPIRTRWNWVLNNRDDDLDLKIVPPDRFVARRGNAGIKFFHLGTASFSVVTHAAAHDAYHPLPDQLGEGRSGSAQRLSWTDPKAIKEHTTVHAVCLDSYGKVAKWHLLQEEGYDAVLEGPQASEIWKLKVNDNASVFEIEGSHQQAKHRIAPDSNSVWQLTSQ